MKVHGIELSKKAEEVVRYFFDLTCHYLAVMQSSGSYYLFYFQAGGERRVGAGDIRFHRNDCYLEVTAADLPYLKKPEGELVEFNEFRKADPEDSVIFIDAVGNCHGSIHSGYKSNPNHSLSGYRWCKPREVDAFEVWWETKGTYVRCTYTKEEAARAGWTAAIASK